MFTKRIIPCLDVRDGRTVKGVRFEDVCDAGDPVEMACRYRDEGADEIVFLDISATTERRRTAANLARHVARELDIPFTIGGGIADVRDAGELLDAGADKIAINSATVARPEFITELSSTFGSQFVVVAMDTKLLDGVRWVTTHAGRRITTRESLSWAREVSERGAGEMLVTSIDHDGTCDGFDIEGLSRLAGQIRIPVIASGGAGKREHFADVFRRANVDAALAASVFHRREIPITELKHYLSTLHIPVRT